MGTAVCPCFLRTRISLSYFKILLGFRHVSINFQRNFRSLIKFTFFPPTESYDVPPPSQGPEILLSQKQILHCVSLSLGRPQDCIAVKICVSPAGRSDLRAGKFLRLELEISSESLRVKMTLLGLSPGSRRPGV